MYPELKGSGSTPETELRRLRILYELLSDLVNAQTLEDVFESAISALLAGTDAGRAAILMFDDDGVIRFKAWRGLSPEFRDAMTGRSPWPKGAADATPILIPDVRLDKSLVPLQGILEREGIRALATIPLAVQSGIFGRFTLYYRQPHTFSDNEVSLAQAVAYHIALATEKKQTELRLAENQRIREAILDTSNITIALKDREGRYKLVNRRFQEQFHVTQQTVEGKTDYDLFPKEVADRFRANDLTVLDTGKSIECEEDVPQDDGVHIYLSNKFPILAPEGTIASVCTIAKDITDRKKAERELALTEERYRAFIQHSSEGIWRFEMEQPIPVTLSIAEQIELAYSRAYLAECNDAYAHMYGYSSASEIVGARLERFLPRSDERSYQFLRSFAASGYRNFNTEITVPDRHGEERVFLGSFTAVIEDGLLLRVWGTQQNITERKRIEDALRRANRNLEQFAYSASHDLKEPIRMIVAFTELLQRVYGPSLDAQAKEYMQFVVDGALRMQSLVADLFEFLQLSSIPHERVEPVDCGSVLDEVRQNLKAAIEKSGATITAGPLPWVNVRRIHLIQLFQNLIDNAIKYAKAGFPPRIEIKAGREGGMWRFSVRDNGIGIAPEHQQQVFGLFKRLHPAGEYPGTGVGLAICHHIVDWYGGRIWVESQLGRGSNFYFTLPGPEKWPA